MINTKTKPNPGSRYIVRELLGQGRWKAVYRAVVRGEWHDRALARFMREPNGSALLDEIKFLLISREGTRNLENVARVYNVFKGEDGDIYLEEELLYRPLNAIVPLTVADRFFRIARDLCNGLASLHRSNQIHRDLKLDNCGIDHSGAGKIFDLGNVTSEGGHVKGSALSRAPELFVKDARCTKQSDVWALGAVLFALRTGGDYPFVHETEARNRALEGAKRSSFDDLVRERATNPRAGESLAKRVAQEFPNGSGILINEMLNIDPSRRPTAEEAAERWGKLLRPLIPAQSELKAEKNDEAFQDIVAYLSAVSSGTAEISSLQWERINTAIDSIEAKLDPLKKAQLQSVRERVREMRALQPA